MKYQIYAGGTVFHIYIAILKSFNDKRNGDKSILVLSDHTPNISYICEALRKENYFENVYEVPFHTLSSKLRKEKSTFTRSFLRNRTILSYINKNSNIDSILSKYNPIEINLFYVQSLISIYFVLRYPKIKTRLIEDGERTYENHITKGKYIKRRFLLRTYIGEGNDNSISEIHVQNPDRLPFRVRHKAVKLDINYLLSKLSNENKSSILKIFFNDEFRLLNSNRPRLLLITQPLSEDGFILEDYKINLYKKILNDYYSKFDIFIKTHPREITNYKTIFNTAYVFPKTFPLELFNIMDEIKFDLGITIFSSALINLNYVKEKVFLGRDYDKKLSINKRIL